MTGLGSIRWVALALVGLAVAAGVSFAAGQVLSERIGLAAEPVSAGRDLAPPSGERASVQGGERHRGAHHRGHATPPGETTTSPPATAPPTTAPTAPAPTAPPATTPAPPPGPSQGEPEGPDD